MNVTLLEQELTIDEGNIPHAYPDDRGFLTIGIGRLIDARKGGRLSPDEIMLLFTNDVANHTADIFKALPWAQTLNDGRQRALVNMCFQMGIQGVLQFHAMLASMEAGDFESAARQALESDWAEQTPNRAARVAELIKTG